MSDGVDAVELPVDESVDLCEINPLPLCGDSKIIIKKKN